MAIDITNAAEYAEVIKRINLWYGSDAQRVINIANTYNLTPEQLTADFLSGSGFEPWYTSNLEIAGYNSVGTTGINYATDVQQALNSNAGSITQVNLKTPIETTINQSGNVVSSGGLTSVATGMKSALTFVGTEVLPAVSAVGLGISLGKIIDSTLYNLNPDFWDNNGMSSLNPETWDSITMDYPDGFLKRAFNTIFGLNPETGETQQYLDANAAAYLAQYMQENGVFASGVDEVTTIPEGFPSISPYNVPIEITKTDDALLTGSSPATWQPIPPVLRYTEKCAMFLDYSTRRRVYYIEYADTPTTGLGSTYRFDNRTVYYTIGQSDYNSPLSQIQSPAINEYLGSFNNVGGAIAWLLCYNSASQPLIDGITDQTGATQPDFSNCSTLADYLNALINQFPDLFNNAVTQNVVNPDGTTKIVTYIPIGTPSQFNNNDKTQPVTDNQNSGNTQQDPIADPSTVDLSGLEELIQILTEVLSDSDTPEEPENPDPTGSGDTPTVVTPTGQASALYAVYNPSQSELNSFGAWLWSSNFIDQVLKLFNNPMQAIIGLHKIFASPTISSTGNIVVGYLDSGVSSNIVGAQYTDIDCGSVQVSEVFGNVFDYTDTQIRLYLPFIGIVDLDVADVMRGTVSVIYHADVITGACLAEVKITRDGSGGTLYQYAGDASVRYPISSGSYMGVVSGVLAAAGSVASAIMTGGATLPLAAGAAAGGLSGAHTQVQHSGNFAGNAGAMGAKKPYLIIERPQSYIAQGYEGYQGIGENAVKTVSQMSGYFKMTDVRLNSVVGAADEELEIIRAALESGVIL